VDPINQTLPLIGVCVSEAKQAFSGLVIKRIQCYRGDVSIIRFRITDLDWGNLLVKGDLIEKKDGNITQSEGKFSLPNIIFIQTILDRKVLEKLEQVSGCEVFNNFIFNKIELFNLLKTDKLLYNHLPATQKLENDIDLQHFLSSYLSSYNDVLLKPINGICGKDIFRLKSHSNNNEIEITYKQKKKTDKVLISKTKIWDWISPRLSKNQYIIQQGIQAVKWFNKPTDIRLNMNKIGKEEWTVSCLLCRVALNGSYVTTQNQGFLQYKQMETLFVNNGMDIHKIKKSIVELGYYICSSLDQSKYHMADLGIDMGVDEKGHIWIYEINPLPYPFGSWTRDRSWFRPIEYGLHLANIKTKENNDSV
jgi:YheC/D like ATP-grasp